MLSTAMSDLRSFTGRNKALRRIKRYSLYSRMLYRSNDFGHTLHVAWIVGRICPLLVSKFTRFNATLAEAMALVHDDAEMITGDYPAGVKSKMSPDKLAAVEREEEAATEELARRYPTTVAGSKYRDLLLAAKARTSLEAQVVQFADKLDAFGEALHEVLAGNQCFVTHVANGYGKILLPTEWCVDYFTKFTSKHPALAFLVEGPVKVLDMSGCLGTDWNTLVAHGQPHTRASLMQPTGLQPYDLWKSIVLENADRREITRLVTPVE